MKSYISKLARGQKVLDQCGDILTPVATAAEGRCDDVQAIKEVFPEPARLLLFFQRLVRGRDHPHIGVTFLGAADPAIVAVFQHAQQFRLQARDHLGDFVDEQGAAFGHLDEPRLGLLSAP